MTNKLRQYFPMIHTRQEVLAEIEAKPKLKQEFYSWKKKYRKEFLNFCTGVKGVKIMYDFISKEILNPGNSAGTSRRITFIIDRAAGTY